MQHKEGDAAAELHRKRNRRKGKGSEGRKGGAEFVLQCLCQRGRVEAGDRGYSGGLRTSGALRVRIERDLLVHLPVGWSWKVGAKTDTRQRQ